MTDDRWALDKIVAHERELGASQARHDAAEAAIERIASEMEKGFAKLESAQASGFGHLRGEMQTQAENFDRKRAEDMQALGDAIGEVKSERAEFRKSLSRVGWAVIAAIVAAAAAQTALSPQVASMATQAIGNLQQ